MSLILAVPALTSAANTAAVGTSAHHRPECTHGTAFSSNGIITRQYMFIRHYATNNGIVHLHDYNTRSRAGGGWSNWKRVNGVGCNNH